MRKIIFLLVFLIAGHCILAQSSHVDSLRRVVAGVNEDTVKASAACELCFYEQDFLKGIRMAQEGYSLSQKLNYEKGKASCLFQLGNQYLTISNNPMALHYFMESLKISLELNDKGTEGGCYIAIGQIYKDEGDYNNALNYFYKAESAKPTDKSPANLAYGMALLYSGFGDVFMLMDRLDSALKYFQRSYECFNSAEIKYQFNLALNGLAAVQFRMGNKELALGYYRQALRNGIENEDTVGMSDTYLGMARLYDISGEPDSSMFYAERSIYSAQRGNVLKNVITSGKLLSKLYRNKNDKAALRYLQMSQEANDRFYNRQKMMQLQNMFISEREREKEAEEKEKEQAARRSTNLEYSMIAVGIVAFIIIFLLLSRSIIVNERWITFFGVLDLLVVFEFINLLIHPTIARITRDSPVLLLLAYVVVASLLIPLHHRLQKRILTLVTEKNKKIRLENARKTIEELEAEPAPFKPSGNNHPTG